MALDSKKELLPVYLSEYGMKIIYHFRFQPNTVAFRLHWHDHLELLRILEGSLILSCANHHLELFPGQVAVISSQMLHTGLAGPNGVMYNVIQVDYALLQNSTQASSNYLKPLGDGSIQFAPSTDDPQIVAQLDAIAEARRNPDAQHPMQLVAALYDLAGLLYKHCGILDVLGLPAGNQMGHVVTYINEHYTDKLTSAMLSQMFGHEEAYFCRKFKKHTGLTVIQYIQILRMEKARKLLTETELSVQDIAVACGFSDAAYFNKRFKALYKLTPSQIRRRSQINAYSFTDRTDKDPL